jgi:D-alanine-D-alanine ligase-like ATP-grasp enzyme
MHRELSDSSVIVVRGGGYGHQRTHSLKSGGSVYHALRGERNTHDLHIQANGSPMVGGRKISLQKVFGSSATLFNCLHGKAAGKLANACCQYGTACTGNSHVHRARHHHTRPQNKHFRRHSIPTVNHWVLHKEDTTENKKMNDAIVRKLSYPVVVYELPANFSRRQLVAEDRPELEDILKQVFPRQKRVFVQPAVSGKMFSTIVMPEFRTDRPYAFPKAQLKHEEGIANHIPEDRSYTHQNFQYDRSFHRFVHKIYKKADLHDLARIDAIKKSDGSLVLLDIETHPRLGRHSLLAESASKVGALLKNVYQKQVARARRR